MAVKVNLRHTLLLPITLPPDTVTQLLLFQYCTEYAVKPYSENVIDSVGSAGVAGLSCSVKTSISEIVLEPLKSICSQSENVFAGAASFQPPPLFQFTPRRSPLMVLLAG